MRGIFTPFTDNQRPLRQLDSVTGTAGAGEVVNASGITEQIGAALGSLADALNSINVHSPLVFNELGSSKTTTSQTLIYCIPEGNTAIPQGLLHIADLNGVLVRQAGVR